MASPSLSLDTFGLDFDISQSDTPEQTPSSAGQLNNSKAMTKKQQKRERGRKLAEFNRTNRQTHKSTSKRKSKVKRAGCIFPVTRMRNQLRKMFPQSRVTEDAAVYMAAAIEYLVSEMLELAGMAAADFKRMRIKPRHIQLSMRADPELNELLAHVTLAHGGVVPHILPELIKPEEKPSKKTKSTRQSNKDKTATPKSLKNSPVTLTSVEDIMRTAGTSSATDELVPEQSVTSSQSKV
jgi:histone H2A